MGNALPNAATLARQLLTQRAATSADYQAVIRACRAEGLMELGEILAECFLLHSLGLRQVWTRREVYQAISRAERQVARA